MLPISKAVRTSTCSRCRVSVLRAFTSLTDVPKTSQLSRPQKLTARKSYNQARTFSTIIDRPEAASEEDTPEQEIESDKTNQPTESKANEAIPEETTQELETEWQNTSQSTEMQGNEASPEATASEQDIEAPNMNQSTDLEANEAIPGQITSDHEIESDKSNQSTEMEAKESIPWYMQVESPKKAPEFLLERQRTPDLPEDPPQILEALLQQLSIDLGLDYLQIMDLRKLEPPPALGSNLIMIIGTARSERHLHTSADRFCRWLRTNYKLRPDADGLLGRDERKLKERRKMRRAKLMGNNSAKEQDDGMSTGWICVDVGMVEQAEPEAPTPDSKFLGFGVRSDGIKVVVQMFTEEKREEIDLESLWGGILQRHQKRLARNGVMDVDNYIEVGESEESDGWTR